LGELNLKTVLVVGATGDVGQGIVRVASEAGWAVVAAARDRERLDRLQAAYAPSLVCCVEGDLGSEAAAAALWSAAAARFGAIDAVVISVNAPNVTRPLLDWDPAELAGIFQANVVTHQIAAKTFIPKLAPDGVFLGIGGGTADFVIPKLGHASMMQACLRMMYRALARERRDIAGPAIRELMIISMVNGEGRRAVADPAWLTDIEVGRHVCAVLADPGQFPGPILRLETREQVGRPDTLVT
jgi:NAD(P)-dependent dehydrogenase (short-subunit alcohol dehydrogenase family)